jgi:hypothetical protein
MAFTAGDAEVFLAGADGTIKRIRTSNGEVLHTYRVGREVRNGLGLDWWSEDYASGSRPMAIALNPSDTVLAILTPSGVSLMDTASGAILRRITLRTAELYD